MSEASAVPHLINSRELLEIIQSADMAEDPATRSAAESMRSWLVFKMRYRTIEIPRELEPHYQTLAAHADRRRK
jgi:hypothetical protein